MSQNYTEFPNTDTLTVSHAKIIDNNKSFRSLNAGTAFPATLLYDGTPCWRTDLNKLYIYDGISAWQDLVPGYTHPSYATTNIDTTGATIIDSITTTAEGHISAMTTRVLTPGDIGALAAGANAVSATKLLTTRAISLSGDVTGTVNFDGTAAVDIVATVANDSHTHSIYLPLGGGTVTGITSYTNVTDSTSTITGALKTSGGLGVVKSIYAGGNVTAYSDIRLKTDIKQIDNGLAKVMQLSGYTYERTDIDMPRQTGVIAQEVIEVLPEAVSITEEGIYGVSYGNMVGLLIEAIKELKAEVDELKGAK